MLQRNNQSYSERIWHGNVYSLCWPDFHFCHCQVKLHLAQESILRSALWLCVSPTTHSRLTRMEPPFIDVVQTSRHSILNLRVFSCLPPHLTSRAADVATLTYLSIFVRLIHYLCTYLFAYPLRTYLLTYRLFIHLLT